MLVVHFSGAPKGTGIKREDHLYPNDLTHVLVGKAQGGISCSTVKPGDSFHGKNRNAIGCIGVIVKLNSVDSLVDVSAYDCGSIEYRNGERTALTNRKLTIDDIESSIVNRLADRYNEWIVKDYKVIGILAVAPFEVSILDKIQYPDDVPKHLRSSDPILGTALLDIPKIVKDFPDIPIYSFCNRDIVMFVDNEIQKFSHGELYF